MHYVHVNSRYEDAQAINRPDGLVVLGTLFQVSSIHHSLDVHVLSLLFLFTLSSAKVLLLFRIVFKIIQNIDSKSFSASD